MPPFKALNVDSDEERDEDVDNTKELQTEEALKLYQDAVSYQSQGRRALQQAQEAYDELFRSDVFTYPEALSELRREELYGSTSQQDGPEPEEPTYEVIEGEEGVSSTLPKLLHASYKNRGQLYLDRLRAALLDKQTALEDGSETIKEHALKALYDLAEALDKDADDVDVWRRAARVGRLLGSHRIARFCLEAVVDGDEKGTDDIVGDAGVDIKVADQDLQALKEELDDGQSLAPTIPRSEELPLTWKKKLALYDDLPNLEPSQPSFRPQEIYLTAERSWASVGDALLERLIAEDHGDVQPAPGSSVRLTLSTRRSAPSEDPIVTTSSPSASKRSSPVATRRESLVIGRSRRESTVAGRRDTLGSVADAEAVLTPPPKASASPQIAHASLRKRTSEAADLPETAEGGRGRSKRIKARESLAVDPKDADVKLAETPAYEARSKACQQGDEWMWELSDMLVKRLNIRSKRSTKPYIKMVKEPKSLGLGEKNDLPLGQAIQDFYNLMQNWDDEKSQAFLRESRDLSSANSHDTLQAFLEQTPPRKKKRGGLEQMIALDSLVDTVNSGSISSVEAACEWLCCVCKTYTQIFWPVNFKQSVVDIATLVDASLYLKLENLLSLGEESPSFEATTLDLMETLFEIHLDQYAAMSRTNTVINERALVEQKCRMNKWAHLANINICHEFKHFASSKPPSSMPFLRIRHVWSSIYHLQLTGGAPRDYLLTCFQQLRKELEEAGSPFFELPNTGVMPEISTTAAEREVSKLETMEFFQNIFQKTDQSPVDLIESLEPLLEDTLRSNTASRSTDDSDEEASRVRHSSNNDQDQQDEGSQVAREVLSQFLEKASASLRLLLWLRLRDAYKAIKYQPKVLSIELRCIQVILENLKSKDFIARSDEERAASVLEAVRDLRELLDNVWLAIRGEAGPSMFECFDLGHVKHSLNTTLDLINFLYAAFLYDDFSQVGGRGGPTVNPFRNYPSETFHTPSIKLHNMQVQASLLFYRLLSEAAVQAPDKFAAPAEDRLQYLKYVHYQFGERRMCKALDSSFLHFMKNELMHKMPEVEQQSSIDLAQVLYDLYDLHCFSSSTDKHEHGCDEDYLDHDSAMQLVDYVLKKASRTPAKDLLKSDVGKAVEKLHGTLDWVVTRSFDAKRNGRLFKDFLRSPLLPVNLYRALQGTTDLPVLPTKPSEALVASKGWFFLKGQLAIASFRAQRARKEHGDKDELTAAKAYYLQDLEVNPERWETWYRLAQAQDFLIEDKVMWSADTLNNKPEEVANSQRAAIHAYSMALSVSSRTIEPSEDDKAKMGQLYYDFGLCLYSATRKPFDMQAFSYAPYSEKFFYHEEEGKYNDRTFRPTGEPSVWKVAAALLKRAAALNPDSWTVQYALMKCLWKLHEASDGRISSVRAVQAALRRIVARLPVRKDANRGEPLLEPIYKVFSITHKMVSKHQLAPEDAAAFIDEQLDAQKQIDASKRPKISDAISWDNYILDLFRMLRKADKALWHHRCVVRIAHLLQKLASSPEEGAKQAKEWMGEERIYSMKTMGMSVWKPEYERPGRHFYYNTHYCRYLTSLVDLAKDLEGIQGLARQIMRKKAGIFFGLPKLWSEVVAVHLKLHQAYAQIGRGCAQHHFDVVDQDEFKDMASKIDTWVHQPENPQQAQACEVLKEVVELKKNNANYVKTIAMDDLIADSYAEIWSRRSPEKKRVAAPPEPTVKVKPPMERLAAASQSPVAATQVTAAPNSPPREIRPNAMSFNSIMNTNGTLERQAEALSARAATPIQITPQPASLATTQQGMPQPTSISVSEINGTLSKPRARLISRREYLKRATDAVSTKPNARAASPKEPLHRADSPKVVITTPARPRQTAAGEEGEDATVNSPPASVHDSADNESELSELEEEEDDEDDEPAPQPPPRKPMFPNLARRQSSFAAAGQGPMLNGSQTRKDLNEGSEDKVKQMNERTLAVAVAEKAADGEDVGKMDVD